MTDYRPSWIRRQRRHDWLIFCGFIVAAIAAMAGLAHAVWRETGVWACERARYAPIMVQGVMRPGVVCELYVNTETAQRKANP